MLVVDVFEHLSTIAFVIYFTIFIKIKEELKKILRVDEKEIVKTK